MNSGKGFTLALSGNGEEPDLESGSLFFIGTATVILRYGGFTILTDPNFLHQGDHIHLHYAIRSKRLTNPAIDIEELPPLDFIVLSHMHDDHFDSVAATKLDKNLPIISTHQATKDLQQKGFTACHALSTWEGIIITKGKAKVRITAMPARHGPGIIQALLPQVIGSMLEFFSDEIETPVFRIYITGDTLVYEDLKQIPQRYSDIDLALLHLGGTQILGVLLTMDAKQGVKAIQLIKPHLSIPIHYNDYTIFKSPLEEFVQAVKDAGLENRVKYLSHGETYTFNVSDFNKA